MATSVSEAYSGSKHQLVEIIQLVDVLVAAAPFFEEVFTSPGYSNYVAKLDDLKVAATAAYNQGAA